MRILLAFDSFKGSVTAEEACDAAAEGIRRAMPDADIVSLPMADGGEGTSLILARALGAKPVAVDTLDPIGRPLTATYYITADGATAIIEIAAASGLALLRREERDPLNATTYGTGLLIKDAVERGAEHIVLTLGGSATTDAGAGILRALGVSLDDTFAESACRPPRLTLVCDVHNPFLGEDGAAHVFAPQKGATLGQVRVLDKRLEEMAQRIERLTGKDIRDTPGAGAAGGVAGTLHALFDAPIVSGIDAVLDATRFSSFAATADIILTGEGRIDRQTIMGKTLSGILKRRHHAMVVALVGQVDDRDVLLDAGFTDIRCIHPMPLPEHEAMDRSMTLRHISFTAGEVVRALSSPHGTRM